MTDLAAWLTAIWDEQEKAAKLLGDRIWYVCEDGHLLEPNREDDTGEYIRWNYGGHQLPNHYSPWTPALEPAVMLARIAADRQILALHVPVGWAYCPRCVRETSHDDDGVEYPVYESHPCPTTRLLASAYADRPGYQESWKP